MPKSSKQATVPASDTENGKFAATVKKMLATKPTLHSETKKVRPALKTPGATTPKAKKAKGG